ncbi:MAG: copper chaperone PCu(A)C [Alphaproteobacteria bacterium]
MKMRTVGIFILCALISIAAGLADGQIQIAEGGKSIRIDHAWSRPADAWANGVVYFTVINDGATEDRLLSVSTAVADKAELHVTLNDNGVMKMRPVASVEMKAHGSTPLAPGGTHVMLIGLKQALQAGATFPLSLTFEKAGTIETTVVVEKSGSSGDGKMDMPGMDHGGDMKGIKM